MKKLFLYSTILLVTLYSCNTNNSIKNDDKTVQTLTKDTLLMKNGYLEANGMQMYYEVYGQGKPLVLLHGGGSTIQTSFGRIIPILAKKRKLICIELQAHGRTGDRESQLSFEQDADDVTALLQNLNIQKTDILGFSNGGNTALQIAIRHSEVCNKIIAASPLLKREGAFKGFWEFMKNGTFEQMPQQYKDAFLEVNPDSVKLMNMYNKCAYRMTNLKDFPDEQIKSIKVPVLLINGTTDVATPEHITAMSKLIPGCKLEIVPGGHGEYMGEITTLKPGYEESDFAVPIIEQFLDK